MSTFHTPPLGITQHNGVYFVASWICRFYFCFLDRQKSATCITVNKLLPNPKIEITLQTIDGYPIVVDGTILLFMNIVAEFLFFICFFQKKFFFCLTFH
jgi:hypothetical protein